MWLNDQLNSKQIYSQHHISKTKLLFPIAGASYSSGCFYSTFSSPLLVFILFTITGIGTQEPAANITHMAELHGGVADFTYVLKQRKRQKTRIVDSEKEDISVSAQAEAEERNLGSASLNTHSENSTGITVSLSTKQSGKGQSRFLDSFATNC